MLGTFRSLFLVYCILLRSLLSDVLNFSVLFSSIHSTSCQCEVCAVVFCCFLTVYFPFSNFILLHMFALSLIVWLLCSSSPTKVRNSKSVCITKMLLSIKIVNVKFIRSHRFMHFVSIRIVISTNSHYQYILMNFFVHSLHILPIKYQLKVSK